MTGKKIKFKKPIKGVGQGRAPQYKFSGPKGTRVRKAAFIEALTTALYNINFACKQADIQRRTYYAWKEADPEFDRACFEIDEKIKDEAETVLQQKITEKDTASTIFFLKTKCKDRGYVERTERVHEGKIETTPLLPGTIVIQTPDDQKKEGEIQIQSESTTRVVEETNKEVPEPELPDKVELDNPPQDTEKPGWK